MFRSLLLYCTLALAVFLFAQIAASGQTIASVQPAATPAEKHTGADKGEKIVTGSKTPSTEDELSLYERVKKLEEVIQRQQKTIEDLENQWKAASLRAGGRPAPAEREAPEARDSRNAEPAQTKTEQSHKPDSIELANGKLKIGALFYGDYAFYFRTGFGPQFLTQVNQPGPGNNYYNSFDVNRAYINFLYSPNDAITLRVTPNLYRQIGASPSSKFGKVSAIGQNVDGELAFRLKYAYLDFNKLFARSKAFGDDKLTIGQHQNPLIDWVETLYGFRFVNLISWNYTGLSSAQTGISLHGPIKFHRKQYLDYGVGVFTNASFRQLEQSKTKQTMLRLSYYPFGSSGNDGLGFTGFVDYAFTNVAPDTPASPLYRTAALVHWTSKSKDYGVAGEFDYGRNAFTSGNLFSGSGPADEFGLGPTPFADFDALVKALQNNNRTKQRGFEIFGHARIGHSKFTVFGLEQFFQPNINVVKNPLDFNHLVFGVSYKYSNRLRFALDSQNLIYRFGQFTFPAAELSMFDAALANTHPNGIPNAVPRNVHALFLNVEFNF